MTFDGLGIPTMQEEEVSSGEYPGAPLSTDAGPASTSSLGCRRCFRSAFGYSSRALTF